MGLRRDERWQPTYHHCLPAGDTEDLAPSTFEGPDAQKPAGVKAGVSARPQPRYQRGHPNVTIPEGQPSAPDFEKELSSDPHEANIPVYPGLNVKNQVRELLGM